MRDESAPYGAAFVEGRRLRDAAVRRAEALARRDARRAARMQARMQAHHARVAAHHLRHARRMAGRRRHGPPVLVKVVLAVVVLWVVAGTVATVLIPILVALAFFAVTGGAVLAAGGAAFALHRFNRRRRAIAAGTAPLPARPAAPPKPEVVWQRARERFSALRSEYAAFECDPMQVLHRPALADVSVGSTARFVDAFAEAQALETDAFPSRGHAASYVSAVDKAERAWRAAVEAADRIRLSGLSAAERSTVERVIKLLTTARDSDSDPERLAAYARARSELGKLDRAGVIHLPHVAQVALDEAARGALPA